MKKVKIAFWVVIAGFVALLIFQNRGFFLAESQLVLDLGLSYYETPFIANAILFLAFFLVGWLVAYVSGLLRQFQDAKSIKALKAKESSLVETVASLEKQLATARPEEPVDSTVRAPDVPTEENNADSTASTSAEAR